MTVIALDMEHHHNGLYDGEKQKVLPTELQFRAASNAARRVLCRLVRPAETVKSIELYFFQPYGGRYLWLQFDVTLVISIGNRTIEQKVSGKHASPVNLNKENELVNDYADSIVETIEIGCKDLGRELRSAGDRLSRLVKKAEAVT